MKLQGKHKVWRACGGTRYATGGARYCSRSVMVTHKGVGEAPALQATNGRILAVVPVEPAEGEDLDAEGALIPLEALREASKSKRPALIHANGAATVRPTLPNGRADEAKGAVTFPLLEGKFPPVDAMIPKNTAGWLRVGLSVELLADLAAALGAGSVELRIPPADENGRISAGLLVLPLDEGAGFGVLMPIA